MRLASTLLVVTVLSAPAVAGDVAGWRGDGDGVYADATPPVTLDVAAAAWKTPLPAISNASPLVVGDKVCGATEPTGLFCADRKTGALLWQVQNPVVDALAGDERVRVQALIADAEAAEAELAIKTVEYSALSREMRKPDAPREIYARGQTVGNALAALKKRVLEARPYRTSAEIDTIGYSSPTPISDGKALYAVYGNGVVASYDLSGKRRWIRWVGHTVATMRGYHQGQTASPRLVGGVLIVAQRVLQGLDPATGATVWEAGAYSDFGTPEVATVGGVPVVFTPAGQLLRATDGKVLASDLGDLWYLGPYVSGDRVYYLGAVGDAHARIDGGVPAVAWDLAADGAGGVTATKRWETRIAVNQRFYASPIVYDGLLYWTSREGTLVVVDPDTGASVYTRDLSDELKGEAWPSPVAAAGRIYVASDNGVTLTVKAGRTFELLGRGRLERMRGSPVFVGDRVYARGLDNLYSLR